LHLTQKLKVPDLLNLRRCSVVLPGRQNSGGTTVEVKLKGLFLKFLSDEQGATAIEYGLIAAGISLAIIAVVNGLGTSLSTQFNSISSSLK
jgi:pilus assembly protein Flp/PilA